MQKNTIAMNVSFVRIKQRATNSFKRERERGRERERERE
jgi:hypothetical protein